MFRTMLISLGTVITISAASSSAHAYCNLSGDMIIAVQSNKTTAFFMNIYQKGVRLQGNAKFGTTYGVFSGYLLAEGRLGITARWDDGKTGIYYGWVTPDGRVLSGDTHESGNPSNSATWRLGNAGNRLQCD